MSIVILLHTICSNTLVLIFVFLISLMFICDTVSILRGKKKFTDSLTYKLIHEYTGNSKIALILYTCVACLVVLLGSPRFIRLIGCTTIEMMPGGQYCYYVNATNSSGKTYTLPAQIEVCVEQYDDVDGSIDTVVDYFVREIHFANGGYVYFDDDAELTLHDGEFTASAYDQSENHWDITLIDKKSHHPDIEETELNSIPWVAFTLVAILLWWCFICLRHIDPAPEKSTPAPQKAVLHTVAKESSNSQKSITAPSNTEIFQSLQFSQKEIDYMQSIVELGIGHNIYIQRDEIQYYMRIIMSRNKCSPDFILDCINTLMNTIIDRAAKENTPGNVNDKIIYLLGGLNNSEIISTSTREFLIKKYCSIE